jgi:hypothetical protein
MSAVESSISVFSQHNPQREQCMYRTYAYTLLLVILVLSIDRTLPLQAHRTILQMLTTLMGKQAIDL